MRRRLLIGIGALVAASTVTAAAPGPARAATAPAGFTDTFITNVERATTVEWLPSDQIAVLEQTTGRLRLATPGGTFRTALDLAVCDQSERGLLGLTADPAFLGNGWIYVYYTAPSDGGCVNRVSRFTLTGDTVDPASELVLLDDIASTGGNHNGGDLDIDGQGNLLVAIGDAGHDPRGDSGSAGANDAAQDLSLLNGKIVRITRTGLPAPGNPFTGAGTSRCATSGTAAPSSTVCREIFAFGLRNPYRIAVDRDDGAGRFFVNDVGQGTFEEVDVGARGANYGWPAREGPCPQGRSSDCPAPPSGVTDPITAYGRSLGTYITAGAFVPSGLWPAEYDGAYLFGDGGSGRIWVRYADGRLDYDTPFATGAFGLTDMTFGFDARGAMVLYYVQVGGGLRMIGPPPVPPQPRASGLKMVPVTPVRAYDTGHGTGTAPGDVHNGTVRLIDLEPPAEVGAALVNLTYDQTDGPGFVRVWASRTLRPATSALNADRPGTIAANSAIVALADDGTFVLESSTTARVVVDVMAWFVDAGGTTDDGRFVTIDPGRVADTRLPAGVTLDSASTNAWARTGDRIDVDVLAHPGLPDDGTVAAAVISVGAISDGAPAGFVGGHPGGTAYTGTSNVNVLAGEIRANMMVIPLAGSSSVSLQTLNVADVVVDVLGYVTSDAAPASASGLYTAIAPTRTVDSRIPIGTTRLTALDPREIEVPRAASGGSALAQNITVTNTSAAGYVSAHPGPTPPVVSSVNYEAAGQTRAAFAFTTVSSDDTTFFTSFVPADLVVDVVGYFSD